MLRIKTTSFRRKKKCLVELKGFRKSRLYKAGIQTFIKSAQNKYRSRKLKERKNKSSTIINLNNKVRKAELKYSVFCSYLRKNKIYLNLFSLCFLF